MGQLGRVIKCMLALSLLHVALIAGAVLFGHLASAHDFYDEKCCYEQDCRPVNCNEIMSLAVTKAGLGARSFSQPTGCISARMAIATFVLASLVWSLPASASICRRAYSFDGGFMAFCDYQFQFARSFFDGS